MRKYQQLIVILSLGLSLVGCGGVSSEDPTSLPVAVDDEVTLTNNSTPIGINVLDNDKGSLDITSVDIITPPHQGTTTITSSGEVKYQPNPTFHGSDSFVYTVQDTNGNFSNPATVFIIEGQSPFKITVKTDNAGVSNNNEFTIPIVGGSYDINCGDPTTTNGTAINGSFTCQYPGAGTYTVSITGDIPQISFFTDGTDVKDNLKLLSINQWGAGQWGSMQDAFFSCSNMVSNATDAPNLSTVTNMSYMFSGATLFDSDISAWDVSNITDMRGMFDSANSFNQNIGGWNVGNVTDMTRMFNHASSFNQDIAGWNVSNVTDMSWMFSHASSFDQNISGWEVANVTNMRAMFNSASSFDQDIGGWNVAKVTNMREMFLSASSFNQNVFSWSVREVTDMSTMFKNSAFDGNIADWDVRNVADMTDMFLDSKLSQTNYDNLLGGWGVRPPPNGLKNGVSFSVGSTKHSADALALKNSIITNFGWSITDGGCAGAGCP